MKTLKLTIRERIAISLVLFAIQMLRLYEWEHKFTEQWKDIKKELEQA